MDAVPPDLGSPVAEYRGSYVFSVVLAVIFLALALLAGIPGILSWGRGDASDATTLFCLGAIPAALGTAALISGLVSRQQRVTAYEKGLVDQRMGGQRVIRWEDITQVTYQPPNVGAGILGIFAMGAIGYLIAGGSGTNLVMTLKNSKKVSLPRTIQKLPDLARQVQDFSADFLFPAAKERLESGGSLSYGSYAFDKEGMKIGKNALRWADVTRTDLRRNNLELYRAGSDRPWFSININTHPNGYVFKRLVENAIAQSKGSSTS